MQMLFIRRSYLIAGILGVLAVGALVYYFFFHTAPDTRERATVRRGDVEQLVSVSGSVRTRNTAELGFAGTGVIEDVLVREGDMVKKGQVLATLAQAGPLAEYNDALAYLAIKEAERDELILGPRTEAREVTESEVAIARENIARTEREENEKVENARRALYSDDLIARPERETNDDTPPTISGTYTCKNPTTYVFETFPSGARSGYSYRILEGDGSRTGSAVSESSTPFSTCGLYIQFVAGETYGNQIWIIDIPNTRGAGYTANLNEYNLAVKNRDNALAEARQNLERAEREGTLANAAPRSETLSRADANVRQARARLASAEAKIAERTIRAPFDGVVTNVAIAQGEIGSSATGITMTANDAFELKIRVPEIDITHIAEGDTAHASFDANPDEIVEGNVVFVSPLPTEIDGVAYFDAFIAFAVTPAWMRTGLNADVDVTIEKAEGVLMLPKRFVPDENGRHFVVVTDNGVDVRKAVEVGLIGNDGFVEIRGGAPENTEVIAP